MTAQSDDDFWSKVVKGLPDECWEWSGYRRPNNGYAAYGGRDRRELVHRYAYRSAVGPIPEGMMVLHNCDNKGCCNPKHLRVGTHADNTQDAKDRGQFYIGARTRSRLTEEDVRYIRKALLPQDDLAALFGVTQGTISRIKSRVRQGAVQ